MGNHKVVISIQHMDDSITNVTLLQDNPDYPYTWEVRKGKGLVFKFPNKNWKVYPFYNIKCYHVDTSNAEETKPVVHFVTSWADGWIPCGYTGATDEITALTTVVTCKDCQAKIMERGRIT